MTDIIAFTGPAGSGKDTAAAVLSDAYTDVAIRWTIPFSLPIREMLIRMTSPFLTYHERHDWSLFKQKVFPQFGNKTGRELAQTLGTEWGRNIVHEDTWINICAANIKPFKRVSIPDLRFPNEAKWVRDMGGKVVRIIRPGTTTMDHASEQHFDYIEPNFTIINDSSLEEFREIVLRLCK